MNDISNPKDIYVIDIYDVNKREEALNKPAVYASIICLALVAQIVLLKKCPWYVSISFFIEIIACMPIVISFLIFTINKNKFYAVLYDVTYGSIDSYCSIMIIGAIINMLIDLLTSYLIKFSIESVVMGILSLFFVIMALTSKRYVCSLTWRIRHYIGKNKKVSD